MFIIVFVSFMFFVFFFYFSLLFFLHIRGSIARVLSQGSFYYLFLDFFFISSFYTLGTMYYLSVGGNKFFKFFVLFMFSFFLEYHA